MSRVKRYSLPIVLGIIAAALVAVGVLAVTVWRPAQHVMASRDAQHPYTMTRVGVFPLYGDRVNVRASVPDDGFVWVAVGSPEDVTAWLQGESYEEIIGLEDLETLKVVTHGSSEAQSGEEATEGGAEDTQSGLADVPESPLQSDMWISENYGRGSVSLTLDRDEMDTSIIAATDGVGVAPTITLTWDTPQNNLLAVISFITAGVIALIAVAVAAALAGAHSRRITRSAHLRTQADRAGTATTEIALSPAPSEAAVPADEGELPEDAPVAPPEEVTLAGDEESAEDERDAEDVEAAGKGEPAEGAPAAPPEGATPEEKAAKPDRLAAIRSETVTTESGMMNLAALRGGGAFPTRRALRDAQRRGVDRLVVGGREYSTVKGREDTEDVDEVLGQRTVRPQRWSEAMGDGE